MKRRVDEVETARKVPRVCVCLGADKSKRVSDSAIPSNGALLHFYWINVKTFKHMNLHFFQFFQTFICCGKSAWNSLPVYLKHEMLTLDSFWHSWKC